MTRILPHILIFLAVTVYIILGGLIFMYFENFGMKDSTYTENNATLQPETTKNDFNFSSPCSAEDVETVFKALEFGCCRGAGVADATSVKECLDALQTELKDCLHYLVNNLALARDEMQKIKEKLDVKLEETVAPATKPEMSFHSAVVLAFTVRMMKTHFTLTQLKTRSFSKRPYKLFKDESLFLLKIVSK